MLYYIIRVIALVIRVKAAWPAYGYDKISSTVVAAVDNETDQIPAELLIAISQHESDFEPRAVTWVDHGGRHDVVLRSEQRIDHQLVVYGYLQAMCLDSSCDFEMDYDGGTRAGAAELKEWSDTCARWSMRDVNGEIECVLRGHAGGTKCALDELSCTPDQRRFVDIFLGRAWELSHVKLDPRRGNG